MAGFACLLEDTSSNYNFVVDKQTFLSDFLVGTVSHLHMISYLIFVEKKCYEEKFPIVDKLVDHLCIFSLIKLTQKSCQGIKK